MSDDSIDDGDQEFAYEDYAEDTHFSFASVAALTLTAVLMIIFGVFYMNTAWDFTDFIDFEGYTVMELIGGPLLIIAAYVSFKSGLVSESMVMAAFGLSMFVFGIMTAFSSNGPKLLDLMCAIVFIVAAISMFATKDIFMGIATILMAAAFLMYVFFTGDIVSEVGGILMFIPGLMYLYCAIGNWLFVETGRDVLPIF